MMNEVAEYLRDLLECESVNFFSQGLVGEDLLSMAHDVVSETHGHKGEEFALSEHIEEVCELRYMLCLRLF